jgi:tetratricopeptide (TPR) repeat protein
MKHLSVTRVALSFCLLLLLSGCTALFGSPISHAEKADSLRLDGHYIEAIAEYRLHITSRLKKRGVTENPYFYFLLIGDCYLALDQLEEAEKSFLEAQALKIDNALIADRMRQIAAWHEKHDDLEMALNVLEKYRTLDPLLFDLEIDRIHKTFVEAEIQREQEQPEE